MPVQRDVITILEDIASGDGSAQDALDEIQGHEANIDLDLDTVKSTLTKISTDWSKAFTVALSTKLIVSATSARIRSASGRIDATAPTGVYYVHCWNGSDVPANATAVSSSNALMSPQKVNHLLGTDDLLSFDFNEVGTRGASGVTFGLSTTEFTQTLAGAYLALTAEFAS